MQTALPVVLALTYPADKLAIGSHSGIAGVLAPSNLWTVLAPIALMFLTGLANLALVGPATTKCMRDRKSQGKSHLASHIAAPVSILFDLTRSREERWEEELRRPATFAGDGSPEQEVRNASWDFINPQPQCFHRLCHIRNHPLISTVATRPLFDGTV